MKILIIGGNGQVGWELQRSLMPLGTSIVLNSSNLNLVNPDAIRNTIQEIKPNVIVNAAAYTAVDKAESEAELAMQINGIAPGVMAEEAKLLKALLIHYSTDYVFDGTKSSAYNENDVPNPLNSYGRSKLVGEQAIQAVDGNHIILRTSWVYSQRGSNFLLTMLRLMQEKQTLRVIDDQVGSPTWARLIAETTAQIITQAGYEQKLGEFKSGLYHLSSAGETSWYGFAVKIAELARKRAKSLKVSNIIPITTKEYPTPAARPMNSRLETVALTERFSLKMPSWDEALSLCLNDFTRKN
jgi:dTDP-4-dehydrorhamnose reductase